MADTKISGLTELAAADVETDADSLAIVDDSATATKKILVDSLRTAIGPKLETEVATTSGTAAEFTSIPAWVKKITVMGDGVSGSGSSPFIIQLGDSGGYETTGYSGGSESGGGAFTSATDGFLLAPAVAAANANNFVLYLTLQDASNNVWMATGTMDRGQTGNTGYTIGRKALSATLDRLRITTQGGSDTFDAGAMSLLLE